MLLISSHFSQRPGFCNPEHPKHDFCLFFLPLKVQCRSKLQLWAMKPIIWESNPKRRPNCQVIAKLRLKRYCSMKYAQNCLLLVANVQFALCLTLLQANLPSSSASPPPKRSPLCNKQKNPTKTDVARLKLVILHRRKNAGR